jgi:hypothetical protein
MIVQKQLLQVAKPEVISAVHSFNYYLGKYYKIQIMKLIGTDYADEFQKGTATGFVIEQAAGNFRYKLNQDINFVIEWLAEGHSQIEVVTIPVKNWDLFVIRMKPKNEKKKKQPEPQPIETPETIVEPSVSDETTV